MAETINTKTVTGRRSVRYNTLDDLLQEAERLAETDIRTIGNWSQGQIYEHLARAIDYAIDGAKPFPLPMRWLMTLLFKNKFIHKSLPAGFKAPSGAVPKPISTEDGLTLLRTAIARQHETSDRAPHAVFGKISNEEWEQFNLRHAEMHMSFIAEE